MAKDSIQLFREVMDAARAVSVQYQCSTNESDTRRRLTTISRKSSLNLKF
jgi:hypothetical protein